MSPVFVPAGDLDVPAGFSKTGDTLQEKRGSSIGLVFMSITLGNTLGASVGLALTSFLSQEQMMTWGWRIPFILGFFLGIISYIIRKKSM